MTCVDVELSSTGFCRQREWLVNRRNSGRWLTFPALVARIRHPQAGVILFDTGYGKGLVDANTMAARMYRRLLPFQLGPAADYGDVGSIFLSHFHPDHIGGLKAIGQAPIWYSKTALDVLQRSSPLLRVRSLFLPELLPTDFRARARAVEDLPIVEMDADWRPFTEARDVLGDGSLLAVELPGHAIGQHGLICRLAGGKTLFLVADAAWVRANITEAANPAWPVRALVDWPSFLSTLGKLRALHARRPDVMLLPSHCEESIRAFQNGQ